MAAESSGKRMTGGALAAVVSVTVGSLLTLPAAVAMPMVVDVSAPPARVLEGVRLRHAVADLHLAQETRTGYDRDKFKLWVDADGDCRDTRDEVLADESKVAMSGCDITRGRWYSYYDDRTWRDSGDVDIDHLVPLAEAWDSGTKLWNSKTRERYANDLGDRRTLVAVTDNVNQSKGDQDIREWLPDHKVCRYLRQWVVVKSRWSLHVDRDEKQTLVRLAGTCTNVLLHFDKARIGLA